MKLVVIESPLSSDTAEGLAKNRRYAAACMRDCLARGEAPYASHLLFDQQGILNDKIPEERTKGMQAGFAWGAKADIRAVYWNLGCSKGMEAGLREARIAGQEVDFRRLPDTWDASFEPRTGTHDK